MTAGVSTNTGSGLLDKSMELSMQELFDLRDALDTALNAEYVVFKYNQKAWPLLLEKINKELSARLPL
jgi:hypothetical protein